MQKGSYLNAFDVLGLSADASREQVKKAYHNKVKASHPDLHREPEVQDEAQRRMVELNLAYAQAMEIVDRPKLGFHKMPLEQIKVIVRRLLDQGHFETALLQLGRAQTRDADWYAMQGEILMAFKEFDTAHQSFREAVRQEPDNMRYRQQALDAAVAVKRHRHIPMRIKDSIEALLSGKRHK